MPLGSGAVSEWTWTFGVFPANGQSTRPTPTVWTYCFSLQNPYTIRRQYVKKYNVTSVFIFSSGYVLVHADADGNTMAVGRNKRTKGMFLFYFSTGRCIKATKLTDQIKRLRN
jgi:hypothetical protein